MSALQILAEGDLNALEPRGDARAGGGDLQEHVAAAGTPADLERSAAYLHAGVTSRASRRDYGYTGINAAFVHDLIADAS